MANVQQEMGFWVGYHFSIAEGPGVPVNPFPRETSTSRDWSVGFIIGRSIGAQHKAAARTRIAMLAEPADPFEPPREAV